MEMTQINKIAISTNVQSKNKFNFAHDNNTTYEWGDVQTLRNLLMQPGSTMNVDMETLTRLAPMVVPTFGRVKMKNNAHFIKCAELWPNFDYFLSKTAVTRPEGTGQTITFIPKKLPNINVDILSTWILTGARVSLWGRAAGDTEMRYEQIGQLNSITAQSKIEKRNIMRTVLTKVYGMVNTGTKLTTLNYEGPVMRTSMMCTTGGNPNNWVTMPINSWAYESPSSTTIDKNYGNPNTAMLNTAVSGVTPTQREDNLYVIYPSTADYTIRKEIPTSKTNTEFDLLTEQEFTTLKQYFRELAFCFKLSSAGKRLRKTIIASGYPIDFADTSTMSLLPLFAVYRAYWITYAPERTKNYYSSNQFKLIQSTLNSNSAVSLGDNYTESGTKQDENLNRIKLYIMDMMSMFATEKMDIIAAATEDMLVQSETIVRNLTKILTPNIRTYVTNDPGTGYAFSKNEPTLDIPVYDGANGEVSQQDLDILCHMYRYVSKVSIAGQNIAAILKANGMGTVTEESKGHFIESYDVNIQVSDVVSQAATEERPLGDWGGKGIGYGKGKFSYTADAYGYLTIISTMVPESGYVNCTDERNACIEMEDFFNPEFDAVGSEVIKKRAINGATMSAVTGKPSGNSTFGYVPMMTKFKWLGNIANGDFSLNSTKNSMLPYTTDKVIPINGITTNTQRQSVVDDEEQIETYDRRIEFINVNMNWVDMPIAGEDWRYVAKYAWNGNYDRIFEMGDNKKDYLDDGIKEMNNSIVLFNSYTPENFMAHHIINMQYWAPMKAIEESYNTFDEEHKPNAAITKQ